MGSLNILDIILVWYMVCKIFLCVCVCVFSSCFWYHIPKITAKASIKECFSMILSRGFIVSDSTIESLFHFSLIIVSDVRKGSIFIILYVFILCFQHSLLKRLFFLPWMLFPPLLNFSWCYVQEFNSGLSILFQLFMYLFFVLVPLDFNYFNMWTYRMQQKQFQEERLQR